MHWRLVAHLHVPEAAQRADMHLLTTSRYSFNRRSQCVTSNRTRLYIDVSLYLLTLCPLSDDWSLPMSMSGTGRVQL